MVKYVIVWYNMVLGCIEKQKKQKEEEANKQKLIEEQNRKKNALVSQLNTARQLRAQEVLY